MGTVVNMGSHGFLCDLGQIAFATCKITLIVFMRVQCDSG